MSKRTLTTLLCTVLVILPAVVAADGFVPLTPDLPGMNQDGSVTGGFSGFLNVLLGASVAIAAVLAVIMLAVGGFKYMTTDSAFQMGGAKEQITNAVVGLLIVLASILLLETINPDLISLSIFE